MAIFIVFALRPTIVSIVTLKKTIVESTKTLQQLDAKVSALKKASTQLEAMKPYLPTINLNIPNEGAMYSPLTTAVEALALQTGTQIESESLGGTVLFSKILSPFAPSKNQSVVELPFSVRVTGNYANVADFLNKLLLMERVIAIESVTITKETGSKSTSATIALSVSGSAYYLANEEQLQKAIPQRGKK
ncbi:MAG: type 4a pilus biogenesis protein PilO [bacterium]